MGRSSSHLLTAKLHTTRHIGILTILSAHGRSITLRLTALAAILRSVTTDAVLSAATRESLVSTRLTAGWEMQVVRIMHTFRQCRAQYRSAERRVSGKDWHFCSANATR
jgi:hypothetical protein